MLRRLNLPHGLVRQVARYAQRPALGGPLPLRAQRRYAELLSSVFSTPPGTTVQRTTLGGRPALLVAAAGVAPDSGRFALVHLHGGAYTVGSPRIYRTFAAHLAELAGCPVYLPAYRLAPEHRYPAALQDALAACAAVAERHEGFALTGDSAGGGLAAAAALHLAGSAAAPAVLGLVSPWVDLTDVPRQRSDLIVRTAWGARCAELYSGAADRTDPGISPAFGDLSRLPRTLVQVADGEVLLDQVRRFADAAIAAGADLQIEELPRLWHVAHLHAVVLAEAYEAVRALAAFVRGADPRAAAPD